MASKPLDELKSYFKTGAKPTEENFADLIDTIDNISDQDTLRKATPGHAQTGEDQDLYMTPYLTHEAIKGKTSDDYYQNRNNYLVPESELFRAIQGGQFKVGGNADTFYPVVLIARDYFAKSNLIICNLNRASGSTYPTGYVRLEFIPTNWGHSASKIKCDTLIFRYDKIIAGWQDLTSAGQTDGGMCVWLRGDRTYYFWSDNLHPILNSDNTAGYCFNGQNKELFSKHFLSWDFEDIFCITGGERDSNNLFTDNNGSHENKITLSPKTTIDSYVYEGSGSNLVTKNDLSVKHIDSEHGQKAVVLSNPAEGYSKGGFIISGGEVGQTASSIKELGGISEDTMLVSDGSITFVSNIQNGIPNKKIARFDYNGVFTFDDKVAEGFMEQEIMVNGDADTYYPVDIRAASGYWGVDKLDRITIFRRYDWEAPDTWNTSTHRGDLLFDTFVKAIGWSGGISRLRVLDFSERYSTMLADILISKNGYFGVCVWLRGGGAKYQIRTSRRFTTNIYYANTKIFDYSDDSYDVYVAPTTTPKTAELQKYKLVNQHELSPVAVSGNYNDLSNKPSTPRDYGYLTDIQYVLLGTNHLGGGNTTLANFYGSNKVCCYLQVEDTAEQIAAIKAGFAKIKLTY